MSESPINRAEVFATLTRSVRAAVRKIFSPRVIQCLLALLSAAAGIGLAIFCWQFRDLLVEIVAICFLFFSLCFAWELLPFSEQTRPRWAQQRELSDRYWSYRWRKTLWFGLGWGVFRLWQAHANHQTIDFLTFALPAAYVMAGAIAHGIWIQHRRRQAG